MCQLCRNNTLTLLTLAYTNFHITGVLAHMVSFLEDINKENKCIEFSGTPCSIFIIFIIFHIKGLIWVNYTLLCNKVTFIFMYIGILHELFIKSGLIFLVSAIFLLFCIIAKFFYFMYPFSTIIYHNKA